VTNEEFSQTLAHILGRPALLTVPGFALKAMFGEMADAMLLHGQRVVPRRLLESGFTFTHPTLEGALRFELGSA
jgi:NAD dependent epimerase/dehydratase family enzyme